MTLLLPFTVFITFCLGLITNVCCVLITIAFKVSGNERKCMISNKTYNLIHYILNCETRNCAVSSIHPLLIPDILSGSHFLLHDTTRHDTTGDAHVTQHWGAFANNCRWKAIQITYFCTCVGARACACTRVALIIQHATRMHYTVCGLSGSTTFFDFIS
jgi:hypothetical protein